MDILSKPLDINMYDPDYYFVTVIKTVLKVLFDNSLWKFHETTLDCLFFILKTLNGRCARFLEILFPVLTNIIYNW